MKNFYITTPIYYVNDKPHIGHAYTNIISDVIARFQRFLHKDVFFSTGTDEHGLKIDKAAKEKNIVTQEFVDEVAKNFTSLTKDLNISNTSFIRTTDDNHKQFVQQVWNKMLEKGYIYKGNYSGWYSVRDEAYYKEEELIDGLAPSGSAVEWMEESSYFFQLSVFQDKLLSFYEKNPDFVKPASRYQEVLSFVKSGLDDLSISRTNFKWGINVPDDSKHVMYVWLDALFNYLSVLKDAKFWPADVHIIGKDILRFHAVYWPAFLMAIDEKLPIAIFAHGWWMNDGEKISKSLGNVVDPYEIMNKFGLDYFRYYLIREVTFGNDGNFSKNSFVDRINAELVNKVGNFIHRVSTLIYKNSIDPMHQSIDLTEDDQKLLDASKNSLSKITDHMEEYKLKEALGVVVELAEKGNAYIHNNAPWKLAKTDAKRMKTVLCIAANTIIDIGILLQPFVPDSAKKILDYFSIEDRSFQSIEDSNKISQDITLSKPSIIFSKIE